MEIRYIHTGVPQGSVLSPLLYNLYIGDFNSDPASEVKTLQYADDVVIYTDKFPVKDALPLLKEDLEIKASYLHNLGLNVSVEKTQLYL